jgi:hypothetical protein
MDSYVSSYRSLRRCWENSVRTRELIHNENERMKEDTIPTINADEKMMRSATNNSWACRDFFWVRECIDVNKIRYITQRIMMPRVNNTRKERGYTMRGKMVSIPAVSRRYRTLSMTEIERVRWMPYFTGVVVYPPVLSPLTSLIAPMMLLFVSWKKNTRESIHRDAGMVVTVDTENTPNK